jgi:hypothetical protein
MSWIGKSCVPSLSDVDFGLEQVYFEYVSTRR